jgi:hypothetical protein
MTPPPMIVIAAQDNTSEWLGTAGGALIGAASMLALVALRRRKHRAELPRALHL